MPFLIFGAVALFIFAASKTSVGQDLAQSVTEKVETHLDSWTQFDSLYQKYALQNSIDWQVVKAFALNESDNGQVRSVKNGISNPEDVEGSKSSDGKSWGIMQMTLATAKGIDPNADAAALNNPEYSINLGCQYIAELQNMFSPADPSFMEWVVKSYNQGPGNTRKEIAGVGGGFADEYWARWQRNYNRVTGA